MNKLAILALSLLLISGATLAQETPSVPEFPPAGTCLASRDMETFMNSKGFSRFFMGRVTKNISVVYWRNDPRRRIYSTTLKRDENGSEVLCANAPVFEDVREFGPV